MPKINPKFGGPPTYFRARFESECPLCRSPIYRGEWVAYGEDNYVICKPCKEEELEK